MPRKAELYEHAKGSPLEGYFLLKVAGKNMPRNFAERSAQSRQSRHEPVVKALQGGSWGEIATLRDWEEAYLKECFYYGIRILLELERKGRTDL